MLMNDISRFVASKIANELSLSSEKQEIIEYGMISLLSEFLSLSFLLVTAFVLNMGQEILVATIFSITLRKYSGGTHCSFNR